MGVVHDFPCLYCYKSELKSEEYSVLFSVIWSFPLATTSSTTGCNTALLVKNLGMNRASPVELVVCSTSSATCSRKVSLHGDFFTIPAKNQWTVPVKSVGLTVVITVRQAKRPNIISLIFNGI